MTVELRHLRALLAVLDAGTFTGAARALSMTQPALGRTVQQLETLLGVPLVERTARGATPTARGAAFAGDVRRVLGDLDAVLESTTRDATVRLGFSWLLPDPWAREVIGRYERESGATVALQRVDDPIAALLRGAIDLAIVRDGLTDTDDRIVRDPMLCEHRIAAVSIASPLASRDRVAWDELAALPLVVNTATGTTGPRSWADPVPGRPVVACRNFDEWLELVAADRGIGVVPDVARRRVHHEHVAFVPIDGAPPITVALAHRRTPTTAATRRFVDLAR